MFNHQGEAERSLTAPLPGPRFIAWWVWTAISFGALVAALWWAGGRRPAWRDEGYVGFVGFVGRVFGGLGTAFRVGDRGASLGARAAFVVALLLLLYVWWRATRAWLAFRPGPVDVQQLEDATRPGTVKPSDTDLTAKLRRCLSESSMYPPTTLPAQAPVEGFLELLGDVELDPHKLGSVLPKVLSRLRPKLAYRVSGILQSRDAVPDQYGMTITVTAFLFGGSRALTVWGRDWDEVIGKASIWIVSTLLPVTRAGRLPPWSHWWGGELRPELYQAYQEATELGRAGRHHEALEQYFKAVQLDPTNPYLRAELAEMQEKMGLYVDALNTTQRALTLDGQTARAYQKRLWQSRWSPHWRRLRYLRHPRRYREVLGLRYRNSIILGTAEVTAEQWYRREGAQSSRIHEELIPILVERYWPTAVGLDGTRVDGKAPEETKRALRRILQKKKRSGARDHCHGEEERSIRLVFQRASSRRRIALPQMTCGLAFCSTGRPRCGVGRASSGPPHTSRPSAALNKPSLVARSSRTEECGRHCGWRGPAGNTTRRSRRTSGGNGTPGDGEAVFPGALWTSGFWNADSPGREDGRLFTGTGWPTTTPHVCAP